MTKKQLEALEVKKLKAAIKKADRWYNKYIVLRDKKCIRCNSEESGQCSHYYGKDACPRLRYDGDNTHRMCKACHCRHHKVDDHWYADWMRHNYGEAKLDWLEKLAGDKVTWDIAYYEAIEAKYKALVKSMEASNAKDSAD